MTSPILRCDVPDINHSPATYMPALHTSNNEVMQKKEIVCPISSQDPAN